jgi:Cu/Ag efflux pump CusA
MRPGAHTPRLSIVRAVLPAAVLILLMGIGLLVLGAGPGREALWDLGAVLAGGAITSSLTTLVVLPAVAARWADREESADDYAIDEHALGSHSVTSYA